VDVSVDSGILTVTAQRSERTETDVQWLSSERFTGGFMRRLSLGADVDAEHIAATYQNGVLTVTLPVAARATPRRIEITHGHVKKQRSSSPATHPTSTPRPNPFHRRVQAGHAAGPWRSLHFRVSEAPAPILSTFFKHIYGPGRGSSSPQLSSPHAPKNHSLLKIGLSALNRSATLRVNAAMVACVDASRSGSDNSVRMIAATSG